MKADQLAPRMAKLPPYFFAVANKKIAAAVEAGMPLVNLGIGSPDLPPDDSIVQFLNEKTRDSSLHRYPKYVGEQVFKEAVAAWYDRYYHVKIDASSVLPVGGSKQALVYITMALVGAGDQVLVPNPGYSTYERAANIAGGEAIFYSLKPENNYLPDLAALRKQDLSKVKMMWISYPHNPTGATATKEDLQKILDFTREHEIVLVSDNPYSHVTYQAGHFEPTLLELATESDAVIECNSMSKTYNMAGWRIGWVTGNAELVAAVGTLYSNIETGIFIPVQMAAAEALKLPQSWIDERNKTYIERVAVVLEILSEIGAVAQPPQAALYAWAKLPESITSKMTSEEFSFDLLAKTGVFIAPGTAFGSEGEGYLRASVCQPVPLLKQALDQVKAYSR